VRELAATTTIVEESTVRADVRVVEAIVQVIDSVDEERTATGSRSVPCV